LKRMGSERGELRRGGVYVDINVAGSCDGNGKGGT